MFGALNRFISRLDSEGPASQSRDGSYGAFGFQVLRNKNLDIAIEPWYDFVISINGRQIVRFLSLGSSNLRISHGDRIAPIRTCSLQKSAIALALTLP